MFGTWPEEAMLLLKLRDSDFVQFFDDGTKLKMLLEIKPPLWNHNLGTKSSELMISNFPLLERSKFG